MTVSRQMRIDIFEKYGGHCAYCGEEIHADKMNVDHIVPKERFHLELDDRFNLDDFENLNPSCRSCNNYKSVLSLEQFRRELSKQVARAQKTSVNFRLAKRYKQIIITETPIVFYFEQPLNQ